MPDLAICQGVNVRVITPGETDLCSGRFAGFESALMHRDARHAQQNWIDDDHQLCQA